MTWKRRTLFLLILLLYAGFVIGLLYLEFFAKTFSHTVGELRVTGRYAPLPLLGERKVRDLAVSYNGLELRFDSSGAEPSSTESVPLRVEYWRSLYGGGEIVFQQGRSLRILRDGEEPSSFTITPLQAAPSAAAVWKLPFRMLGSLQPTEATTPILSWEHGRKTYYLSLPGGSRVDAGASALLVRTDDRSGASDMHLCAADGSGVNAYAYWLSQEASLPSEEAYRSAVSGFLDAAWNGWSRTRLAADGTFWTDQDGKASFREETANAFTAEALARSSYPWARTVYGVGWNAWRYRSPAEIPEAGGSAYLGNLVDLARRAQARDPAELARLDAFLKAADPALFSTPRLIPYLLDHGSFNMVQETLAFLRERASTPLGSERTLGVVEACLDAEEYVDGEFAARGRAVVENRLLSMVRNTDLGIFLVREDGTEKVDVLHSLRAGALLLRAGEAWDLPVLRSIGRGLLASALSLKGEAGYLPAGLAVSVKNALVTSREGSLAPETAYPYVAPDRHFPREIPLSRTFEPGVWIWSAAKAVSAEHAAAESRFLLSFPSGQVHFLMIQGIKPFKSLTLHAIPWVSDPAYAQYPDGWVYDAGTQTLFLKLTHRQDMEEIRIQY